MNRAVVRLDRALVWQGGFAGADCGVENSPATIPLGRPAPRLAGFTLLGRLGSGPTCEVFKGTENGSSALRAIKILRPEATADPANIQLILREAELGQEVRHPHLVHVFKGGCRGLERPHVLMKLIPGESLRTVLVRKKWLNPRSAATIGLQVAGALACLHEAGIVHGDVKPENIHFASPAFATLLDLGFARRPERDPDLAGKDFVLGTANYLAPELCEEDSRDGPAVDVFSLGVTLFELLTGQLPYPTGHVELTLRHHRDSTPDSLWKWNGRWPIGLAALVDSMLDRRPECRPPAREVQSELTGLFSWDPLLRRPA